MNAYKVMLIVACAAVLDTGRRIEMCTLAHSPLEAAIACEEAADATLLDEREYTHARRVTALPLDAPAVALAA